MATSFVTSASGDSGLGSSTLNFSAGMPNNQLPNSVLVFTYAETSSVITDVNVINGVTTTPMPLIPNSTVSFDLGFLQAYFISIPAGSSNSFLTTSDIVINRNSGEPGLAAAALWLSTGSTGYVSAIDKASSQIGTYSFERPVKGKWRKS